MFRVNLQAEPGVHRVEYGEAEQASVFVFEQADDAPGVVVDQGVPQAPHDVAGMQVAGAVGALTRANQKAPHRFEIALAPVWAWCNDHIRHPPTRHDAVQRGGGPCEIFGRCALFATPTHSHA